MTRSALAAACFAVALLLARESAAQAPRALEVRADTLLVNSATRTVDARGHVRITDGRAVILAARAIYQIRERRVQLSGGISMTSPDGTLRSRDAVVLLGAANTLDRLDAQGTVVVTSGARTIHADRLTYAFSTTRVMATGRVQITTPAAVATGRTLSADMRGRTGTLTGARIRSKEGIVSGERLDITAGGNQAVFRGHVVAEFEHTKITSEIATVFEREKKAVFRGKVKIARPGRVLLADTVTFYYQENRMVAEGQTRILIQESP
ncbi:MAG TPA: hypothetical protein VGK88_10115 [bacterium]